MTLLIIAAVVVMAVVWFVRHQHSLRRRAWLMREAIDNRDFTFRLPTDGLLPGEQAMQETLNQLGEVIHQQMNQNEVESWEKLTRVLTHEIMNSMAPIASISQSMLRRDDVKGTPLEEGISAINNTATRLNTFIDNYRKLSLPLPNDTETTTIESLTADLRQLYPQTEISLTTSEPHITLPAQLSHVFINLTKNAIEARARKVAIAAQKTTNDIIITISNDGEPIPAEARASIFIPFFTTKRNGNGIGLSLSRRMLIQQGGSLSLLDQPLDDCHTSFEMRMPIHPANRYR